jgi:lipopolysaccharide/colanic/teichoic acid biosynthesis glycosyltransferase
MRRPVCAATPESLEAAASARPLDYAVLKRTADMVIAAALLVLTAPLVVVAMLIIKLTSRGPVMYLQTRMGRDGVPFTIYKLRTMYHQCEQHSGACWSVPGDPRITPWGRILRRTHLDELPQLFNVLFGEMSLVGPRPERPEFVQPLEQALPRYGERLQVRPGVTGLAQIQLPADTDLASVRQKLKYDLFYVEHYSFWLDLRLMLGTGLKMFGVPFAMIRTVFSLPTRQAIDEHYETAAQQPA